MLYRIKNIFYSLFFYCRIKSLIKKYDKKIFLIGTPWHGNIGESGISNC